MIGFLLSIPQSIQALPTKNISINNTAFTVEIASTPQARAKGLMFRTELKNKEGMLFSYTKPRSVGIWMKNTYIPLDILWINENNTIFYIHEKAVPHSLQIMRPNLPAKHVLELNAGSVKRYKIKAGNKVKLN